MSLGVVAAATADLVKALETVPDVAVTTDPGTTLASLPAVVIGAPRLTWEGTGAAAALPPTSAMYPVWVVVDADELAIERLWQLVVEAAGAIDQFTDGGVVVQADPGVFPSGTAQLPCYDITVEWSF